MNSTKGTVKVHNVELCYELLGKKPADSEEENSLTEPISTSKVCKAPTCSSNTRSPTHALAERLPSRSSTSQAIHAVEWLSHKARRAVLALPDDPQLANLKKTCEQVSSEEYVLLSELNEFLAEEKGQEESKKAMLYKKWKERVFEPIHNEVSRKMDSSDFKILDSEKRKLFDNYLTYSTKQEVFLDTISPDEYNPDKCSQLRIKTSPLSDPLIAQNDDAGLETRMIEGCEGNSLENGLPWCGVDIERGNEAVLWLAMELVYIDSTNAQIRRRGMLGEHNKCSEGSGEGELRIPHKKRPLDNDHQPLTLQWK